MKQFTGPYSNIVSHRYRGWLRNGYFAWVSLAVSIAAMLLLKRFSQIDVPILLIWLAIAVLVKGGYQNRALPSMYKLRGGLPKEAIRYS